MSFLLGSISVLALLYRCSSYISAFQRLPTVIAGVPCLQHSPLTPQFTSFKSHLKCMSLQRPSPTQNKIRTLLYSLQ